MFLPFTGSVTWTSVGSTTRSSKDPVGILLAVGIGDEYLIAVLKFVQVVEREKALCVRIA